jgi:hypothetical protein
MRCGAVRYDAGIALMMAPDDDFAHEVGGVPLADVPCWRSLGTRESLRSASTPHHTTAGWLNVRKRETRRCRADVHASSVGAQQRTEMYPGALGARPSVLAVTECSVVCLRTYVPECSALDKARPARAHRELGSRRRLANAADGR